MKTQKNIYIFNENTEEYNVKTSENHVQCSNFNMGEMDKSREFYSKEGDNSSQLEGNTEAGELFIFSRTDLLQI